MFFWRRQAHGVGRTGTPPPPPPRSCRRRSQRLPQRRNRTPPCNRATSLSEAQWPFAAHEAGRQALEGSVATATAHLSHTRRRAVIGATSPWRLQGERFAHAGRPGGGGGFLPPCSRLPSAKLSFPTGTLLFLNPPADISTENPEALPGKPARPHETTRPRPLGVKKPVGQGGGISSSHRKQKFLPHGGG